MSSSSAFPIGAEVEVRSNEEGFKGAWFEAKVLKYASKYRRYTLSFSALVSDEAPARPLEDSVYYSFVRPRPPRSDSRARFAKHQLVEAFHNDGWWKGVVVSIVPKGKGLSYRVCFPTTREEYDFERKDLREQMEWLKGSWVPVQKMEGAEGVMYDVGSRVEVSRDKIHFGAAWFIGTISKVIGKSTFLVEYNNLRVDGNPKTPLQEIVDLQFIRPWRPPSSEFDRPFDVLEAVEAFHKDRWVAGVVSEVRPESLYIIRSKHQQEEIEVKQTALRPHFDWENEHWVNISRENNTKEPVPRKTKSSSCKRKSRSIKISTLPILAPTPKNNDEGSSGSDDLILMLKMSEGPTVEGSAERSQPIKTRKKEVTLEEHLKLEDKTKSDSRQHKKIRSYSRKRFRLPTAAQASNNDNGKVADEFGAVNCGSNTPKMVEKSSYSGVTLEESPSRQKAGTKLIEVYHDQEMARANGTESVNSVEGSSCCFGDVSEHLSKAANFGPSPVEDEAADILPIADWGNYKACRGLTKNTKMQSEKLAMCTLDQKRNTPDVVINAKQHAKERKIKKRNKQKQPKKIACINGMTSKQLEEKKEVVGGEDWRERAPIVDTLTKVPSLCHDKGNTPDNDVTNVCLYNMQVDIMDDSHGTPEMETSILYSKSLKHSNIQQSPTLESVNIRIAESEAEAHSLALHSNEENVQNHGTVIPNGSANVVELETAPIDHALDEPSISKEDNICDPNQFSPSGSSLSREDNVPIHKKFTPSEMLSAPSDPSFSGLSLYKVNTRDQNELAPNRLPSEEMIVEAEERVAVDFMCNKLISKEITLPFTKESTMWEIVESMEVFHTAPQQPHFRPLEQFEVEFREGMAIGLMVTFANLVAGIQKLRITDSQDIFEEKLKALVPLESNGFNVQSIRCRLVKLLEIRNSADQAEGKKASLKEKIMEKEDEKEQLDILIAAHDKIILELEENLRRCREKRKSMLSGSSRKASEIVQLKKDLETTEEAYFSADAHFNASIGAPWW